MTNIFGFRNSLAHLGFKMVFGVVACSSHEPKRYPSLMLCGGAGQGWVSW